MIQTVVTVAGTIVSIAGTLCTAYFGAKIMIGILKKMSSMKTALSLLVIGVLGVIAWGGSKAYHAALFRGQVESYVKAAYNTNDREKACRYLDNALVYLRERGANEGFTSVLAPSQEDDLAEFYGKIKAVRDNSSECCNIHYSDSAALWDWQRGLINHKIVIPADGKTVRTAESGQFPDGISLAPYNREHAYALALSCVMIFLGGAWTISIKRNPLKQECCSNCGTTKEQIEQAVRAKLGK